MQSYPVKNSITRRKFISQTAMVTAGMTVGGNLIQSCKTKAGPVTANVPMPVQIVIDDVGWWTGEDGNKRQEPYRTGIMRNHVPADYQAIADLGSKLGVRPQAATILCEWDRKNILREVPTITWMREKWDNSKWVGPWLDEAAEIIRSNKDHYELTLHGVGHEYWDNSNFTRAEWADKQGTMRPLDQVELHLDYFAKIMEQNQLGPFPTSFVPTAFLHGFGRTGDHQISMAGVVKKRGIRYINTPFDNMFNAKAAQYGTFGIDDEVITVDRGDDVFGWNVIGGKPAELLKGPTCGMHWPNLLHADPKRNTEIVDAWVKFLKPYNDKFETLLAKDSSAFTDQLVHHGLTKINVRDSDLELDFSETDKVKHKLNSKQFTVKLSCGEKLKFNSETIKITGTKVVRENDSWLHRVELDRLQVTGRVLVGFEVA